MDMSEVTAVLGLLVALSIASERLVEIVKGFVPALSGKSKSVKKEGVRRSINQALAVAAGIITAFLARPAIPEDVLPATGNTTILALGLLASGGSGLWNAVLQWVLGIKDLKDAQVKNAREKAGLPVPN